MIRTLVAAAALGLCLPGSAAWAQTAEDAFGLWLNPENQSNVELYKCGSSLCAKITKNPDGQKTDDKNPDPAKRNRPIVGLVIMKDGKKTGPAKWSGSLYNRENGKTYSGSITVKSKNAIDLAGCVAVILCKTTTWTRLK
jgi:uncharacterized protein (DUF2147 family)